VHAISYDLTKWHSYSGRNWIRYKLAGSTLKAPSPPKGELRCE
jgi:hypothetical protein